MEDEDSDPPAEKLLCGLCHEPFSQISNLARHLEAHQQMDRKQIFRTFRQVEYSVELVCSVCDERFSNRSTLSDHMMSRHTLEIFQCGVCIESYNSEVTLKKHIERVHGPIDSHNTLLQKVVSSSGANVNDFCDKRDDTASAAVTNGSAAVETEDSDLSNIAGGHRTRQALKRKSEGTKRTRSANWKKVKVSVKENATCGEGSPSGVKLEPKDIHQENDALHCEICGNRMTRNGLRTHREICTPETFTNDGYKCPFPDCGKVLKNYGKFASHRASHVKRFQCTDCGQAFGQKVQLQIHMAKHGAEKRFMCHLCSKLFIVPELLRKHMAIHAPDRARAHRCEECDSAFYSNKMLQEHIKYTHRGHRDHMCDVCGAYLRSKKGLRDHMNRHTGARPHKCTLCTASFTQESNLKRHQIIHTKQKPFKCDECGKSFPFNTNLKRHKLLHTGEKPYQCDRCEMSFNQKGNLNTHMLLHRNEKPHKCGLCEKAFTHKVCLVQHNKNHHGVDPKSAHAQQAETRDSGAQS